MTTAASLAAFLAQVRQTLDAQWVDTRPATLERYGEHTLPADKRVPGAVLFPESTADVQAIVAAANAHGGNAQAAAAALEIVDQADGDAGAGGPDRVTERDAGTVDLFNDKCG